MEQSSATGGWRVSQVSSLLDMPRRDITRSCYADRRRGGAGILQPDDGSWGRRSYSVEDIAWLYLVKLQHEAGYSLPEIAQRMDTSAGINALCGHLDVVAGRAEEMLDGLRLRCERARALRCALSGVAKDAQGAVERYLRERIGSDEVELIGSDDVPWVLSGAEIGERAIAFGRWPSLCGCDRRGSGSIDPCSASRNQKRGFESLLQPATSYRTARVPAP